MTTLAANGQEVKNAAPRWNFTLTKQAKRPSVRFGKLFRADFRANFQTDWRGFEPEESSKEPLFELHRARVGVEGEFLKHFEYEVEYELGNTSRPLRDVFVNVKRIRWLQFKGGKFKIPFSLNQLQGPSKLDFIYRSGIGALLAPGRNVGGEVHGRLLGRRLNYEFGVFRHDGEISYINHDTEATGGVTYAARLTGTPLQDLPLPAVTRSFQLGGAFTSSDVSEGMKGMRGRTAGRETFFPGPGARMFVNGQRRRLGAEMLWTPGPFSVKGEFIEVREERKGQSIRGLDLPDLISRGWYLSGTWLVTGQKYSQRDDPAKHFIFGRGIGAVELAVRAEQLRFAGAGTPGTPPSRSTRGANVLAQSNRAWTFGVNWYMNRWIKTQANVIREKLEDVQRSPVPGKARLWTWVVRVQYVL